MDSSQYRREYAAYYSALESMRYEYHSGLSSNPNFEQITDRYGDLFTAESVIALLELLRQTPPQFETERSGLRALAGIARQHFAGRQTKELTSEVAKCEASATIEWRGTRLHTDDIVNILAGEPDAGLRRELAARWYDALRPCDDLRAARLAALSGASRALGFEDYLQLGEDIAGVNYRQIAGEADRFLRRTSAVYNSRLARWAARDLPPAFANSPEFPDSFFFRRAAQYDALFPRQDLIPIFKAAMGGLGIRVEAQPNLHLDDEARPRKKTDSAAFAVGPPDDVRLVVGARGGGADFYRAFFYQAGRAEHYAWASRGLAERYPEFIHAPDKTTGAGCGLLFAYLFHDPLWLAERRGMRPTEAGEIARAFALVELHDTRLCCAQLLYAVNERDVADARSEHLAEAYTSLFREATGFGYSPATRLTDAGENFRAASLLRARLFAAALTEGLRARHGRRWWATRAAGDKLIDMWNTASRYSVEELARLTDLGNLDFDLLADTLMTAVSDG